MCLEDAALPEAKTFKIFPANESQAATSVWKVFLQKNALLKHGIVYLDQYREEVLRVDERMQLGTQVMTALYPLHIGICRGLPIQSIYFIIGFAPVGIFITGLIVWWSKTYGAKSVRRRRLNTRSRANG